MEKYSKLSRLRKKHVDLGGQVVASISLAIVS